MRSRTTAGTNGVLAGVAGRPPESHLSRICERQQRGKNARPLTFTDRPRPPDTAYTYMYSRGSRACTRPGNIRVAGRSWEEEGRGRRVYFSLFTVTTFSASSFRPGGRNAARAATGERFFRSEPATRGNTYHYTPATSAAMAFTRPGGNIVAKFVFINVSTAERSPVRICRTERARAELVFVDERKTNENGCTRERREKRLLGLDAEHARTRVLFLYEVAFIQPNCPCSLANAICPLFSCRTILTNRTLQISFSFG